MSVVAGVKDNFFDLRKISDLCAHTEGKIDEGLRLVFGAMLFRVAIEDGAFWFSTRRKRNRIFGIHAAEYGRDDALFTFINGARRIFAAHRSIDSFDGELSGVRGSERFPAADLSFARLACSNAYMHGLLNRLVDGIHRKTEQRSDPRSLRRAQMSDVIDMVFVKTDGADQINLDFIGRGDPPN